MNTYLYLENKELVFMIKITSVAIERFRSILNVKYKVETELNLIAFCGENNVGKTNSLRALNLFFYPSSYEPDSDMPKIKHATGGGATHPKIVIEFYNTIENVYYEITRNIKDFMNDEKGLSGIKYKRSGNSKKDLVELSVENIEQFINKFEFIYIESINTFMPKLIDEVTKDMIDVEYDKARFSQSRKDLKIAYDTYVDGLQEILNVFAGEISNTFRKFKQEWDVKLVVPKNSETFRDLISHDVILQLNDNGSNGIIEKGSGLQRLTEILLTFEMVCRMKNNKQMIVCIDEPDVYLHEGLQRKLKDFFDNKSEKMQIFYSTHSKVFINPYSMKNVFLLSNKVRQQYSTRKRRNVDVVETILIDTKEEMGYNLICQNLGIEQNNYEILQPFNLLVEGTSDKNYIEELCKYFNLPEINIIAANGATNSVKYLDFYESYYKNSPCTYKPKVRVIFDNDNQGRTSYKKVKPSSYNNIIVKCELLKNYCEKSNVSLENNKTNNEIEDFIYPELLCFLVNTLFDKKNMAKIDVKKICRNIVTTSFSANGILALCEHEKNEKNPENGNLISFVSTAESTNSVKEGLAKMFVIQGNRKIIDILDECNKKYPNVRKMLEKICSSNDFE